MIVCSFADDLEIANDCILDKRATLERCLIKAYVIDLDANDRADNIIDKMLDPRCLADHTGLASAMTSLRNLMDKSADVLTSTFVLVRCSTAIAIAAMSNRVMPSAGSIRRSQTVAAIAQALTEAIPAPDRARHAAATTMP